MERERVDDFVNWVMSNNRFLIWFILVCGVVDVVFLRKYLRWVVFLFLIWLDWCFLGLESRGCKSKFIVEIVEDYGGVILGFFCFFVRMFF